MEQLFRKYQANAEAIDKLQEEQDVIKAQIMQEMKEECLDSYMSKSGSISYIPKKVSYIFDASQFKKDEPEVYEKYMTKERVTNEQIRISTRKS